MHTTFQWASKASAEQGCQKRFRMLRPWAQLKEALPLDWLYGHDWIAHKIDFKVTVDKIAKLRLLSVLRPAAYSGLGVKSGFSSLVYLVGKSMCNCRWIKQTALTMDVAKAKLHISHSSAHHKVLRYLAELWYNFAVKVAHCTHATHCSMAWSGLFADILKLNVMIDGVDIFHFSMVYPR